MRRILSLKLLFRLAGLCILAGGSLVWIAGQGDSPTWKEFTLTTVSRSIAVPNGHSAGMVEVQAHRSDGAKVTLQKQYGVRDIILPQQGKAIKVTDSTKTTTTFYNASLSRRRPPAYDAQCGFSRLVSTAKPVLKGEDTVLGYRTIVIQTETGPYSTTV